LRGVASISGRADGTVVALVQDASQKAQMAYPTPRTDQWYLALLKPEDGIAPQNKFGKEWQQTKVTTRLVVSYFNWMWEHSRFGNTAALACRSSFRILVLA